MKTRFSLRVAALTAAAAVSVMAVPAGAQSRAQPTGFVVPYPPGGAADQITRLVAQQASVTLGTPIVVDNKGGAGGIIAAEAVAGQSPRRQDLPWWAPTRRWSSTARSTPRCHMILSRISSR
ncbi:hypothetical protein ACTMU2_40205 [Cupriavidus basilensis]